MFEEEKNGYNKQEVDYYIKRLDDDFHSILKSHTENLECVKSNITQLTTVLNEYSQTVPIYKSEIESLHERLNNIRTWTEESSKSRYMPHSDKEVILANLITQILNETDNIEQLKLVEPPNIESLEGEDFFEILANHREIKLDDALMGFDFFDNNPYKNKAEKKLAKIEKRKKAK